MSNTITNFLVGIGFDYDGKATKEIGSGIDSVKSKALQLGAVVAGAFGVKALTADFANANDELGKFSQVFNVSADDVSSFGRALAIEGGTVESFIAQLSNLEKLRAGTKQGDFGFVAAAQLAGVDTTGFIEAKNATEAYLALAEQFQGLLGQQRLNAANAFGLDDSSIRLLSRGRDGVKELVEQQRNIRPVTDEMTKASAEFNDQILNINNNIGGLADRISVKLLPEINNVISGMNDWISVNREFANEGIDGALDFATDNPSAIAAGTGLATAGGLSASAGLLSKIPGVGGALGGASRFGAAGLAVGSAALLGTAIGTEINKHLSDTSKDMIGRSITEVLSFFGNDAATRTLMLDDANRKVTRGEETTLNEDDVPVSPSMINGGQQQINLNVQIGNESIDRRIMKVNESQNNNTLQALITDLGG